mmetsp:Transcript_6848/g.19182  ORF Transcript_6848/g.19182 Transcript_6848/m.19182 type:complete len:323 (+) Transcript_6848:57-1025(+)
MASRAWMRALGARRAMSGVAAAGPTARLRRSVLYMPASNPRALAKVPSLAADGVILDLEDAVAPELKPHARDMAVEAAERFTTQEPQTRHKEIVIRVNGIGTEWHADDLAAVSKSKAHAMLVPKVETAEEIRAIEVRAAELGAPDDLALWCMIETPLGVINAPSIAGASPRVQCLVVGTVDLANELHCLPSAPGRWNLQTALAQTVLAARAHKKAVLDGVFIDFKDEEGFTRECRQGRELGFDGKTLIHPATVDPANAVFSPSEAEVERAHAIVAAHLEAVKEGSGVATLNGKLVEALHVKDALRIIGLARDIADLTAARQG